MRSQRTRGKDVGQPRRGNGESGQALLELALVVPLLVLLVMAIFQFAYVFESQMGLTNAVREAARRAAATTNPTSGWVRAELCGSAAPACDAGLLAANVQAFDEALLVSPPAVSFCTYSVDIGGTAEPNYQINVVVAYRHPVFFVPIAFATDLMDGSGDGSWEISASAQMRLERGVPSPAPGACT
jgi:Flp pilus assembly protein TadG